MSQSFFRGGACVFAIYLAVEYLTADNWLLAFVNLSLAVFWLLLERRDRARDRW